MRTTVTLDGEKLARLMRGGRFKSKAKAVEFAVQEVLRLRTLDRLEALRGTVSIDKRVLKWRHIGR